MDSEHAPTHAELYRDGKRYSSARIRLSLRFPRMPPWRAVAAECGVDVAGIASAAAFAAAVDSIAANCGEGAKELLLSGHPRLPVKVVMRIGRTHPERQRFALEQVRAGRAPLGKPPAGAEPPFDTLGYGEVLSRLARNAGALNAAADGLLAAAPDDWPGEERLAGIAADTKLVRTHCRSMDAALGGAGGQLRDDSSDGLELPRKPPRSLAPAGAGRAVALARGVAAKTARDLPRVVSGASAAQLPGLTWARVHAGAAREGVRALRRAAERLNAVVGAWGHDPRNGPSGVPGTYVVLYRLPAPAPGLVVGDLGAFDFPAGVYAYLGSAFGAGGVRKRTHRHLTRDSNKKWNIDWLKPLCTPLAVWWTHDRDKVEFAWADALAALPGASFPAARFGAGDNRKAEAHLVRFGSAPPLEEFRRLAGADVEGHAPVHRKAVRGWSGAGWPVAAPRERGRR